METIHEQQHAQPGTRARPNLSNTTCARAPTRTKPWRTALSCKGRGAQAADGSGPRPRKCAGQAGRRSAQVCARDWRRPAGGGGSGSFLRTTDWIRGRAGLGSKEGFERRHGRLFRLPHRPARVGRTSLPERPHRAVVGRQGCAFGAHHRPRLRARDGESERFRQRSTWRSGRVSEGRSPANNGHATR